MHWLLIAFLILFTARLAASLLLDGMNMNYLKRHGHEVPQMFQGEIDTATLSKISDYTLARGRVGLVEELVQAAVVLIVLFSGLIPWLAGALQGGNIPFVAAGILFFFAIAVVMGVPGLPFDLYHTFVIERRFGFNTTSFKLWLSDLIKSTLVSAVLGAIILGVFFWLMQAAPRSWWLWMWAFYFGFQLLITILYPLVIAPLFNKFEPLTDAALKDGIVDLMTKAGLKAKGVFKIDAGKRSRHSNAYFTGLGRTKRIVLFDTLLDSHSPDEILAVLAHEIGHWKKGHVRKQVLGALVISLGVLSAAWWFVNWPGLYAAFGIPSAVPYVGLLLLGFLAQPVFFFLTPLRSMLSRRFERQADDYSRELFGRIEPLVTALKRLAKDNLANLHPHPLYAWFHYSHPALRDRIARLLGA